MKHYRFSIAILFICTIYTHGALAQKKNALLIGINKYVPAQAQMVAEPVRGRGFADLQGCANDATAVKQILTGRYGFKESDIRLIIKDGEATRDAILDAIKSIVDKTLSGELKKGDVVFIYYAGHGSQVPNSLSPEADKLDETIVPCDAYSGVKDIRDKELAALFNQILDRGVELVVVFDSCHSGSSMRGLRNLTARDLPADNRDAKDASNPPAPERRENALFLSAAQDFQSAHECSWDIGGQHGAFTSAFTDALREVPLNESALGIFKTARSILISHSIPDQEPVIAGTTARLKRGFFGDEIKDASGNMIYTVNHIIGNDSLELDGGLASGLRPCSSLISEKTKDTLKITSSSGISKSYGILKSRNYVNIHSGDRFRIVDYAFSAQATLSIYLGESPYKGKELIQLAEKLKAELSAKGITWNTDPVTKLPDYTIYYENKTWHLEGTNKLNISLGNTPIATQILARARKGQSVFLSLPVPEDMAKKIKNNLSTAKNGIFISDNPGLVQYYLSGRVNEGKLEYALMVPDLSPKAIAKNPLSVRTSWEEYRQGDTSGEENSTGRIIDYARNLSSSRAFLSMSSPDNKDNFPYRLVLKNLSNDKIVDTGKVYKDETYIPILKADKDKLEKWRSNKKDRYFYIFGLQNDGSRILIYPQNGNFENNTRTLAINPDGSLKTEIAFGMIRMTITPPFGNDTYFFLSSEYPISDPQILGSEAVRGARGVENAFTTALRGLGTNSHTRGFMCAYPVSDEWGIMKFTLKSVGAGNN